MSSGSPSISPSISSSITSSTPSQTPSPPLVPTWLIITAGIFIPIVVIIVIITLYVKPADQSHGLMNDVEFYHTNKYHKMGGYFYSD
jgi:hypothetical protein